MYYVVSPRIFWGVEGDLKYIVMFPVFCIVPTYPVVVVLLSAHSPNHCLPTPPTIACGESSMDVIC